MNARPRAAPTSPAQAGASNAAPPSWSLMLLALAGDLVPPVPARVGPSRRHRAPKTEGELQDERKSPRRAVRVAGVA